MLYMDKNDFEVYNTRPEDSDFESFTPSLDIKEGWLVVAHYTVYDSYNSYDDPYYQVIDLYDNRDNAIRAAKSITANMQKLFYDKENEVVYDASGEPVKYFEFGSWGTSFKRTFVKKVIVKEHHQDFIEFK